MAEETKAKIRAKALGRVCSPETREKLRRKQEGRILSQEDKEKIRAAALTRGLKKKPAGQMQTESGRVSGHY